MSKHIYSKEFEHWYINKYTGMCVGTRGRWRDFSHCKEAWDAWQAGYNRRDDKALEEFLGLMG